MSYRLYLWVEGSEFDPDHFQSALPNKSDGEVCYRKKIVDGEVVQTRKHWRSKEIEVSENNGNEITKEINQLVIHLKPFLKKIKPRKDIQIVLEVVGQYSDCDSVTGIYFPPETLLLLSEVGAALDLDQYCN